MKRKHHIRSDSSLSLFGEPSKEQFNSLLKSKWVEASGIRHAVTIEFDGGTPCNIPRLGYGLGYGSYQIRTAQHQDRITRVEFGVPMSANVAEISTLTRAIKSVMKNYNPETVSLDIYGDSKIALGRCERRMKATAPEGDFKTAANELFELCSKFAAVKTNWRGRIASVRLFGH